ncbi:MAG: hypothetical protein IH596_09175 [Bacteroidales bacterium]|nr:hypothetical protein [Bacteroidales bacterium]
MLHPRFWILIPFALFTGCGSSTSGEVQSKEGITPGTVYENIPCRENPGYSYAVYLPSTYHASDSLPLFLAFDPNRMYCTGFSGGSRVASMIAFYGGGIKGVIGSGAGLPDLRSTLRIFQGIHAWPPVEEFESAIRWHWSNAMNDGIMAYTFSNQVLSGRNKEELARMIGIYEVIEPENSYISYLKEQLNSLP